MIVIKFIMLMLALLFQVSAIMLCSYVVKDKYSIFWIFQLYSIFFTVYGGVLFLLDKPKPKN